jgi:hypothetical protein
MARKFIEDDHQEALIKWADISASEHFPTNLLHSIPMGGYRNPREGARLKAQGARAGVPDLCLPVARHGFHGLYIEMKRPIVKGEPKPTVSPEQKYWIEQLRFHGYKAEVCYGWSDAQQVIKDYLKCAK